MTIKETTLKPGTRKNIYDFILERPGLHIREISREIKIPFSTLIYHLRCLEKCGLISITSGKKYVRVYAAKNIGCLDKKMMNIMRQETPRNIILYIAISLTASQEELSRELGVSSTAIGRHLRRLAKLDIIEPAPVENGVTYSLHDDKITIERSPNGREIIYRLARQTNKDKHLDALVQKLLTQYKAGLVDDTVKSILEYCSLVNPKMKLPKKVKYNKNFIDQFMSNICETFPHPYHI